MSLDVSFGVFWMVILSVDFLASVFWEVTVSVDVSFGVFWMVTLSVDFIASDFCVVTVLVNVLPPVISCVVTVLFELSNVMPIVSVVMTFGGETSL